RPLPPDRSEVGSGTVRLQAVLLEAARRIELLPGVPARRAEEGSDDPDRSRQARRAQGRHQRAVQGKRGESRRRKIHGRARGLEMRGRAGGSVFAPFRGRRVVARMGADSPVGSVNFALLRHDMALGRSKVQFYSLYMHLADELKVTDKQADWIAKPDGGWK